MDKEYGNYLERQMINMDKSFSGFFLTHLLYSRGKNERSLKFCQECVVDETEKHGEAFWHRSHQFQGVRVCHKHGRWLYASSNYLMNSDKIHLVSPNIDLVMKHKVPLRSDENYSLHLTYSKMVNLLLNCDAIHLSECQRSILCIMGDYGVSSKNYEIYSRSHDHFVNNFRSFFGVEFIEHINGSSEIINKEYWLRKKPMESSHPVSHILKMMYYGISLKRLVGRRFELIAEGP